MSMREKVESLIEQVGELPADALAEFVESVLEMRAEHLGIYHADDDVQEASALGGSLPAQRSNRHSPAVAAYDGSW